MYPLKNLEKEWSQMLVCKEGENPANYQVSKLIPLTFSEIHSQSYIIVILLEYI